MNYDYFPQSIFSRTLLTSVFAGIIATLACLFFDVIFRETTHFNLNPLINVSTLIFAVNLIFLMIGILYYGFKKMFKRGDLVFSIVFLILTLFCAWRAEVAQRSADKVLNAEFHTLLTGVVVIMGICAAFMIPFLFNNRKFKDFVV
jgi:O-antigen ligase